MSRRRRDDDDDDDEDDSGEYAAPAHEEDNDAGSAFDGRSDIYSSITGRMHSPPNISQPNAGIPRHIGMNGLTSSYINNYMNQLGQDSVEFNSASSHNEQVNLHGRAPKRRNTRSTASDKEESEPKYRYMSLQEIQFKTRNDLKGDDFNTSSNVPGINYAYTEPGCIGCQCGILMKRTLNVGIEGFDIIAGMINQELFRLNFMEIMIQIKNIYDEYLKNQIAAISNTPPRNWSLDAIRYHLVHCVCDPAIDIKYKHYDSTFIYEGILKKIATVSKTDSEDVTYNMSEIRKFIAISQFQNANLTRNPERSMGFQPGITPTSYRSDRLAHLNKR